MHTITDSRASVSSNATWQAVPLAAFVALALFVGAGCISEGGDEDPVYQTALCSGPFVTSGPVHHATGHLILPLGPDPAEDRPEAAPPAEDWRFAVSHSGLDGPHFTRVLGCVRRDGVERWSVAVEIDTNGPVTGEPVSLDTERSDPPPAFFGAVSWRGEEGRVQGLKHFGGALAAGGEAIVTLLDPEARRLTMTYSGYVNLDIDVTWDAEELYPECMTEGMDCGHGLTCQAGRCEP